MPDYSDFDWGQQEQQKPDTGLFGDFDWSEEAAPTSGAAPAQVSQETVESVTKQPVGRPEGAKEEPKQPQGEAPMTSPEGAQLQPDPTLDGALAQQEEVKQARDSLAYTNRQGRFGSLLAGLPQETLEKAEETKPEIKQFIQEEGLPVVGATVGTLMAPVTGGSSLLLSSAIIGGSAGLGGFLGEAVQQTGEYAGVIPERKGQEAPKDAWEILERAAWRGGEEAAWAMVPDLFVKGLGQGMRRLLTYGSKPAVTVTGETVDMGRKEMIDMMKDYAEKHDMEEGKVLLTSDIVESGLFNAAENVAANSYITGKLFAGTRAKVRSFLGYEAAAESTVKEVRDTQQAAIKEAIQGKVKEFKEPALNYLKGADDVDIENFVAANMDNLNDFGVAGLVNVGFEKAVKAQEAVAGSYYKYAGELMEATRMQTVYKEVELPIMGPNGRPLTTMQTVTEEVPAFPVDLRGVRMLAEDEADIMARTGGKVDRYLADLMNMPVNADFNAAHARLKAMRRDSRSLGSSTAEGAKTSKYHLDRAIKILEGAMEDAASKASEAGIVGSDGATPFELMKKADAIWAEKSKDFQNAYIKEILKKADPTNGAPEKLGSLFMKNEMAATKIMKVLDDAKGTLTGDALEQITQAENAIKGSIVEQIFMPIDSATGKYVMPDVSQVMSKESSLRRIFGDEGYDELRKLGAAIEQQSGGASSNYLGFAQRARESGMIMTTLKGLSRADLGPLIRDGSATVLFALGAGKLLTSPKMIRQVNMILDPKVDPAIKTNIAQWLIHRTYEYQQVTESKMTPEQRERAEAKLEDFKEADMMRNGL